MKTKTIMVMLGVLGAIIPALLIGHRGYYDYYYHSYTPPVHFSSTYEAMGYCEADTEMDGGRCVIEFDHTGYGRVVRVKGGKPQPNL